MPGQPTPERKELIQNRRNEAMRLKLRGWSCLDIGYQLHADPAHNTRGAAYPQGYGIDAYEHGAPPPKPKRLAELVSQDLLRARRERDRQFSDNVTALRGLQVERYENLMRDLIADYERAGDDDLCAGLTEAEQVEAVARAREQRHKLRAQLVQILTRLDTIHGVARPVRSEVSGPDGGPIEVQHVSLDELERVIDAAGDGPATPSPPAAEDTGGQDQEG